MTRTTLIFASLLAIWASPAFAQVIVTARPVLSYYAAPAPVSTFYAPAYAPVTTFYGGPVVTPVVGRPVVVGRSVYGTLTPYVPGQPVRNALRFTLP